MQTDIYIYILADNWSLENKQNVSKVTKGFTNSELIFLDVTPKMMELSSAYCHKGDWGGNALFLFLADIITDVSKILNLSANCVITGDISTIYDADLSGCLYSSAFNNKFTFRDWLPYLLTRKYRYISNTNKKICLCTTESLLNLDLFRKYNIRGLVFKMMNEGKFITNEAEKMLSFLAPYFKLSRFFNGFVLYSGLWSEIINYPSESNLCFVRITGKYKGQNLPDYATNLICKKWYQALEATQKIITIKFRQDPKTANHPSMLTFSFVALVVFIMWLIPQRILNIIFDKVWKSARQEKNEVKRLVVPHFARFIPQTSPHYTQ